MVKARTGARSLRAATSDTGSQSESSKGPVRIGRVVAVSLAAGFVVAVGLVFAPFVPVKENVFTGVMLLGFAIGWGLLAGSSIRLSDQPQRWAMVPAAFMAIAGVIVLIGPHVLVEDVLSWVWPPALLALVIWTYVHAKRQLHSRTRVFLISPVLAVLLVVSIGGVYERIGRSVDPSLSAMRGQLVDVGGYRLHIECTGSGGPTVVLEPGAGGMSAAMGLITPAVARDTRVCVYDRAGRGWSDAAANAPDGAQIAKDLHALLRGAHIPGPYVLAGHSFGGLYVMSFAAQFPRDVAGMVIVDSTEPNYTKMSPTSAGAPKILRRISTMASTTSRLGLGRLLGRVSYSNLPTRDLEDVRASSARASDMVSVLEEYVVGGASARDAGELATLGGKPLVVLTAGRGSAVGWGAAQDKIASLSTNARHRVVADAAHADFVDNPRDAAVVSRSIRDVVVAVRTSKPLGGR